MITDRINIKIDGGGTKLPPSDSFVDYIKRGVVQKKDNIIDKAISERLGSGRWEMEDVHARCDFRADPVDKGFLFYLDGIKILTFYEARIMMFDVNGGLNIDIEFPYEKHF